MFAVLRENEMSSYLLIRLICLFFQNCVRAMDQTWHANHFSCYTCDKQFTAETGYHEHQGRPFCEPCYSDAALPKCKGCAKPIKDKAIKALNADWHLSCFVCKVSYFLRYMHFCVNSVVVGAARSSVESLSVGLCWGGM